jgi:hypothetical protein
MGRRIRILSGVDRAEFDGEPVGLQRYGNHHFDRCLFAVHLFHSTESEDTRRPERAGWPHFFGHECLVIKPFHGPSRRLASVGVVRNLQRRQTTRTAVCCARLTWNVVAFTPASRRGSARLIAKCKRAHGGKLQGENAAGLIFRVRMGDEECVGAIDQHFPTAYNMWPLSPVKWGGKRRQAVDLALRVAIFDHDVAAFDIADLALAAPECLHQLYGVVRRRGPDEPGYRHRGLLLAPRAATQPQRRRVAS